jgi:hypothetical protein
MSAWLQSLQQKLSGERDVNLYFGIFTALQLLITAIRDLINTTCTPPSSNLWFWMLIGLGVMGVLLGGGAVATLGVHLFSRHLASSHSPATSSQAAERPPRTLKHKANAQPHAEDDSPSRERAASPAQQAPTPTSAASRSTPTPAAAPASAELDVSISRSDEPSVVNFCSQSEESA